MYNNELYHHGVLNQKWGVRRYQNLDGSLTALGREHYGYSRRSMQRRLNKLDKELAYNKGDSNKYSTISTKSFKKARRDSERLESLKEDREKIKKQVDEILKMAGDQGYSVVKSPTNRFATRYGERLAKHFAAASMAVVMGMFLPVGIGVGGKISYTTGTKYKVKNPSSR